MKIVVSGSSGLIGSALVRVLRSEDDGHAHEVLRLVRRPATAPDEIELGSRQPGAVPIRSSLRGVDAAINLAGAGTGDKRWSDDYKQEILESRLSSTRLLIEALASLEPRPRVLLSGSAVGYYGDTGDREVDENSPAGTDFLADVARAMGSRERVGKRRGHPHGLPAYRHRVEHQGRRVGQGAAAVQGGSRAVGSAQAVSTSAG